MNMKYYVPFITARRLKELGYNEPSTMAYNTLGELHSIGSVTKFNYNNELRQRLDKDYILAPTYHEALSWLEGKGYHVCTLYFVQGWAGIVNDVYVSKQRYASRENALHQAIKFALDDIQKGEEQ